MKTVEKERKKDEAYTNVTSVDYYCVVNALLRVTDVPDPAVVDLCVKKRIGNSVYDNLIS